MMRFVWAAALCSLGYAAVTQAQPRNKPADRNQRAPARPAEQVSGDRSQRTAPSKSSEQVPGDRAQRDGTTRSSEQVPLPLPVASPEDLAFKEVVERYYLMFNLMAGGKTAFDQRDFSAALNKWDTLMRIVNLPSDIESSVRPLASEARLRLLGEPASPKPSVIEKPQLEALPPPTMPALPPVSTVRGTVSGGGALGPGGTVLWLKRRVGPTPRPRASSDRLVVQRGKTFIPHVLAVPIGTKVLFRNDDLIYHNVFSLSHPNEFDLGMYKQGLSRAKVFDQPGPVDVLCNVHASMNAFVYVVDSPYFTQADERGQFTMKNVPPGEYTLQAWHELSSAVLSRPVSISGDSVRVSLTLEARRSPPAFVPDKTGKLRQPQLGY